MKSITTERVERKTVVITKQQEHDDLLRELVQLGWDIKTSGASCYSHPGTARTSTPVEWRIVAEKNIP